MRRAQFVAAAAEVYAEAGYHGASLREIAKRVGLSHAGLLYYFPSREALLAAVLERREEEDAARVAGQVKTPEDALRNLVTLAGYNAGKHGIVELYVRLAAEAINEEHPAHGYFQEHYTRVRTDVRETLQELADQGALRSDVDPATAATAVVALMDGLQVQWLTDPQAVDMAGVLGGYLDVLLKEPLS